MTRKYYIVVTKGTQTKVMTDCSYPDQSTAEYFINWLKANPIFSGCTFSIAIEE